MNKIVPPYYFFSCIALEVILHLLVPIYKYNISHYQWIGLPIIVIGILVNLQAKGTVLKSKSTVIPFQKPRLLVRHGPFHYSRNPMYLGMLLVLIGESMLLGSLSAMIAPILFVIIITIKFIKPEEKILENVFEGDYKNYKKEVRRWI